MHWANFLHIYQPHVSIVTAARRWQESGAERRLREEYLSEHPQVDARQLTVSS